MNVRLEGIYTIYRESDMSVVYRQHNTIQGAGIKRMHDIARGASSTVFNNSQSRVEVNTSGGSGGDAFAQTGCESGFPDHSTTDQVEWRWKDSTDNTYTVDNIDFGLDSDTNGTMDLTFSSIGSISSFDYGDNTSDVSKPSSENWIYEYRLSFSSAGDVVTGSTSEGVDLLFRYMTGNEPNTNVSDDLSGFQIEIIDSGTSAGTAGYTSSDTPNNNDLQIKFKDASSDSYTVDELEIQHPLDKNRLRDDTTANLGTKDSDETWKFTYTLTTS